MCSKNPYNTWEQAQKEMEAFLARHEVKRDAKGAKLIVYLCPECQKFHYGHNLAYSPKKHVRVSRMDFFEMA